MNRLSLSAVFSVSIALRLISAALLFTGSVVLARWLGPSELGKYSILLAAASVLAIPLTCGIPSMLVRLTAEFSHSKDIEHQKGVICFAFYAMMTIALIYALSAIILKYAGALQQSGISIAIVLLITFIIGLDRSRAGILQGLGRGIISQVPEYLIRPTIFIVVSILCLAQDIPADHKIAVVVFLFSALVGWATGGVLLGHFLTSIRKVKARTLTAAWLRLSIALGAVSAMGAVMGNVDVILLGLFTTPAEVGVYKVAVQLASIMLMAQTGMSAVISSRLAHSFAKSDRHSIIVTSDTATFMFAGFATSVFVIFIMYANQIVSQFYGPDYESASETLKVLAMGQLINSLTGPALTLLTIGRAEGRALSSVIVGGSSMIVASLLLIPTFGAIGAGVSVCLGVVMNNAFLAWRVRQVLGFDPTVIGVFRRKFRIGN